MGGGVFRRCENCDRMNLYGQKCCCGHVTGYPLAATDSAAVATRAELTQSEESDHA